MMAGIAKVNVFPDPVGAIDIISFPSSNNFIDLDCISLGASNPSKCLSI